MEIRVIDMEYLVNGLHLRKDAAGAIDRLKQGNQRGYQRCLEILEDPSISRRKDKSVLACLIAKLNGKNTITV